MEVFQRRCEGPRIVGSKAQGNPIRDVEAASLAAIRAGITMVRQEGP